MTGKSTKPVEPSPSGAIVAVADMVYPVDIDKAAEAFQKFDQFKKRILTANDVVDIQGKLYLKKSAWTKWALVCNVSDRLVSYERIPPQDRDDDGGFYYRVVWEAFHQPTGRSSVGTGIVSSKEKKTWAHEEHDIFATACTRAKNRAVSNLVGGGELSAEEMIADVELGSTRSISSDDKVLTPRQSVPQESLSEPEVVQALTEYPLPYNKRNVGIVRIDREKSEVVFIPGKPIPEDCGPVKGFMQPRILEPLTTKYKLQYRLDVRDGILQSVSITPLPEPQQLEELMTGIGWTFAKGSEIQQ